MATPGAFLTALPLRLYPATGVASERGSTFSAVAAAVLAWEGPAAHLQPLGRASGDHDRGRMIQRLPDRLRRGILLAPLVLVLHFLEESPSFVPWFNAHVARGITQSLFWTVNLGALLMTALVAVTTLLSNSGAALAPIVAWLSFLMLTNAIFHIVGTAVDLAYVPGLVTAILLYLPYCAWLVVQIVRSRVMPVGLVAVLALLGAVPMAVHGYRILFLGDRLF